MPEGRLKEDYISQKIWALISVIIVSEPDFETIRKTMSARIINTVAGCVIGLVFIYAFGATQWSMLSGVALAVFISTSFKNYPASWKLAPVTVVIVMIKSVVDNAVLKDAESLAVERTLEVLYGSFVAFILGWIASMFIKQQIVSSFLFDGKSAEENKEHE